MAAVDELQSPDVSALVRLARKEPLNMRQFAVGAQVSPSTARAAHQRLEHLGLIRTDYTEQGALRVSRIWLTPLGRAVADRLAEVDELLEGSARAADAPKARHGSVDAP